MKLKYSQGFTLLWSLPGEDPDPAVPAAGQHDPLVGPDLHHTYAGVGQLPLLHIKGVYRIGGGVGLKNFFTLGVGLCACRSPEGPT